MKRIVFAGLMCLAGASLIVASGCGRKEKPKVVEVKTVEPEAEEALDSVDVAMLSRSLVDAINMGEKLDSTYNFHGILTDGSGKALYTLADGRPGVWDVVVDSPGRVFLRNTEAGNLQAEDLRVYIAQAIGLNDNDVMDAGVVDGNEQATAVVYNRGNLRMEMTLLPDQGENVHMTVAFIRQ